MKRIKKILGILFAVALICQLNTPFVAAADFKLKSFRLTKTTIYDDEWFEYEMDKEGPEPTYVSITAKSQYGYKASFSRNNEFFYRGTFTLIGVTFGFPEGAIYYSGEGCDDYQYTKCVAFDFGSQQFTLKNHQERQGEPEYYEIKVGKQIAHPGQDVTVEFKLVEWMDYNTKNPKEILQKHLRFTSSAVGTSFDAYLNSDNTFVVPSNAKPGYYQISYAAITYADGNVLVYPHDRENNGSLYTDGTLEIVKDVENKDSYTFNSSDYSKVIESDIDSLSDSAEITVITNGSPIISKSLFEKIQNTNRMLNIDYQNVRWSFYGKDIDNPKTLEVSTKMEKLSEEDKELFKNSDLSQSVLMEFTDNGNLPGKALIRVRSEDIKKYFESDTLFVYHYDDTAKTASKVAANLSEKAGYFEFYINHNSKYILTATEMVEEEDVEIDEDPALAENEARNSENVKDENKTTVLIIVGVGIVVLLAATLIPYWIANKDKKEAEPVAKPATKENGFYDTEAERKEDEEGEGYIES